jgi:WhiB family redox-sensing transcriptional regulator
VTGIGGSSQTGRDRASGMAAGSDAARAGVAFWAWMSRGACLGVDPELFFPVAGRGPALHQISAAKRVCQHCTVCALCLTYAVQTRQSGIWGGTTLEERFAMRDPARWQDKPDSRPAQAPVLEHAEPAGRAARFYPESEHPTANGRSRSGCR